MPVSSSGHLVFGAKGKFYAQDGASSLGVGVLVGGSRSCSSAVEHHRCCPGHVGAVLPGVTVEAASDVLIEKVPLGLTDGNGQYRIVDLRPGTYTVTFTLTGFSTLQARRVELLARVHRHGQRRSARRRARGNDHRHRREPDRRRAERQATARRWTAIWCSRFPPREGTPDLMVLIPSMVQSGGGVPNVQLSPG